MKVIEQRRVTMGGDQREERWESQKRKTSRGNLVRMKGKVTEASELKLWEGREWII